MADHIKPMSLECCKVPFQISTHFNERTVLEVISRDKGGATITGQCQGRSPGTPPPWPAPPSGPP